jgi:hypothetical protein
MRTPERHSRAHAFINKTGHTFKTLGRHARHADAAEDAKMISRAVHEHERHDHPGEKLTKLKLADGGVAEGDAAKPRPDRGSRGHGKGKTSINIVVMPEDKGGPQGGQAQPVPVPVPHPVPTPPPAPPPHPGMPPGVPMMPPGMMPGVGAPAAMPPRPPVPPPGPMPRKHGGRAHPVSEHGTGMPHLTGGSGSGVGRKEKADAMERHGHRR